MDTKLETNRYLCKKDTTMQIITAREFRSNQTRYFREAKKGASVVLTSREGNFRLVPVTPDDTLVNRHLLASLKEVKAHMDGTMTLPKADEITF